ncbi:MAG: DALR domain-containing protein, partial [Cyanobium sp.]
HYRKPLDFTGEALEAAATGWKGLNAALLLSRSIPGGDTAAASLVGSAVSSLPEGLSLELANLRERFIAAMDDDLNSSAALAVLFELARPLRSLANRLERGDQAAAAEAATAALQARARLLSELAGVLGLVPESAAPSSVPEGEAGSGASGISESEILAQIEARKAAKAERDFTRADAIRAALRDQGIELIDQPGGVTEWLRG